MPTAAPKRIPRDLQLKKRKLAFETYERLLINGYSVKEAAEKVGYTQSTIYRWGRTLRYNHTMSALSERTHRNYRLKTKNEISEALLTLYNAGKATEIEKLIALFRLSVWMLLPIQNYAHDTAVAGCLIAYCMRKFDCITLSQIPLNYREMIESHIDLYTIQRLLQPDVSNYEIFSTGNAWEQRNVDQFLIANICEFLLSCSTTKKRKMRPSLAKAHTVLTGGGFGYEWDMSRRNFDNFIRYKGAAMPVLYVNIFHHSELNFHLDPGLESFFADVEATLSATDALRQLVAESKWVTKQLHETLDSRAVFLKDLPEFPDFIVPERVKVRPLRDDALTIALRASNRHNHMK